MRGGEKSWRVNNLGRLPGTENSTPKLSWITTMIQSNNKTGYEKNKTGYEKIHVSVNASTLGILRSHRGLRGRQLQDHRGRRGYQHQ